MGFAFVFHSWVGLKSIYAISVLLMDTFKLVICELNNPEISELIKTVTFSFEENKDMPINSLITLLLTCMVLFCSILILSSNHTS